MPKKMINIRLDSDLWKQAKLDAVSRELTLQDWLENSIRQYLVQNSTVMRTQHSQKQIS